MALAAGRMTLKKKYRLLEVTGIELQYMVVDRATLAVRSSDELLLKDASVPTGDVDRSPEPVGHVIELKTTKPTRNIPRFRKKFHSEVVSINAVLEKQGCMLMPTGMHPFMDPTTSAAIRGNGFSAQNAVYGSIFDLLSHGWSNVQSMHLNLPFANDDEFAKLHAAIRVLLPIIPALSASSPILDGRIGGALDMRMQHYMRAHEKLPQIIGQTIPEAVFNQEDYYREVFAPMAQALAPFDKEQVLDHFSVNSRGAIARFDRGSIEIRVIDMQECPGADLAIAELISATIKGLCSGKWMSSYVQRAWHESDLLALLKAVIEKAGGAGIGNAEYLRMFGIEAEKATANDIWEKLFDEVRNDLSPACQEHIALILEKGCLGARILKRTGKAPDHAKLVEVYSELAKCLAEDKAFV
ncbi:MAG: glutamate-cysteine ligase family protein [Flavobacteriales bacterium]